MTIDERLAELGINLPEGAKPMGNYVRARQTGNLLYIAGHGSRKDGVYPYLGKVGSDVTLEQGYESARYGAINCLASARDYLGSLDRVSGVVKVLGYVASAPGFNSQPRVVNGASDVLVEIFGEAGRHARSAVGVAELPENIPVEIEMILEIKE
jgi:enamine deaminase RidA (YjgF/YER057c/UK114 family)